MSAISMPRKMIMKAVISNAEKDHVRSHSHDHKDNDVTMLQTSGANHSNNGLFIIVLARQQRAVLTTIAHHWIATQDRHTLPGPCKWQLHTVNIMPKPQHQTQRPTRQTHPFAELRKPKAPTVEQDDAAVDSGGADGTDSTEVRALLSSPPTVISGQRLIQGFRFDQPWL